MASPDPLDNIMGMLRDTRSIDPNQASARRARLEDTRGQMGVAPPGAQRYEQPDRGTPGVPTREEGGEGLIQTTTQDMTPVIIDQLNEAILSLKLQIHQTAEQKQIQMLEQQANTLREQIKSLGGEPIWAHESIEEGLQKIRGYGYVGADRVEKSAGQMLADLYRAGLVEAGTKYKTADVSSMYEQHFGGGGGASSGGSAGSGGSSSVQSSSGYSSSTGGGSYGSSPVTTPWGETLPGGGTYTEDRDGTWYTVGGQSYRMSGGGIESIYGGSSYRAPQQQQQMEMPQSWIDALNQYGKDAQAARAEIARIDQRMVEYQQQNKVDALRQAERWKQQVQAAVAGVPVQDILQGRYQVPQAQPQDQLGQVLSAIGAEKAGEHAAYKAPQRTEHGIAVRPYLEGMGAQVVWDQATGQVTAVGPYGSAKITPSHITPEGVSYASEQELQNVMRRVGELEAGMPGGAPIPQVNPDMFNDLLAQYGIAPMSPEEIDAQARAMVERQKWDMQTKIEKELERFERNFPNEFEQAKKKIMDTAAEISADRREEYAARGLFYGSMLVNATTEIDEKTMELIGDISRDAANYVAELNRELMDIEQWAILEREVVRRQLQQEDMQLRMNLSQMALEVATHADMFALDAYYKGSMIELEQRRQEIEELSFKMEKAEKEAGYTALAFLNNEPLIAEALARMNITPEMYNNLPLIEQAKLIQTVEGAIRIRQEEEEHQLNLQTRAADIALKRAQVGAIGREAAMLDETTTAYSPFDAVEDTETILTGVEKIITDLRGEEKVSQTIAESLTRQLHHARTILVPAMYPNDQKYFTQEISTMRQRLQRATEQAPSPEPKTRTGKERLLEGDFSRIL